LDDPVQMNLLTDPALCHGVAGVLATTWHTARDAATPALADRVPKLLRTLLHHIADAAPDALLGLIEGSAGIALTLHTITTGDAFGAWPACLLLA
jgi:lantibiotic modifying enzyme